MNHDEHEDELETLRMEIEYVRHEWVKTQLELKTIRMNRDHLLSMLREKNRKIEYLGQKIDDLGGWDRGV
jgi:predicted  nucleic acid-binding Zn-ribbon protein